MHSVQSSSGAETSQHHTQYPSLQIVLDFHQSSLLNTRNNSHYTRLISHLKLFSTFSLQTGILILWPFVNKIMIPSWAMLWWHYFIIVAARLLSCKVTSITFSKNTVSIRQKEETKYIFVSLPKPQDLVCLLPPDVLALASLPCLCP